MIITLSKLKPTRRLATPPADENGQVIVLVLALLVIALVMGGAALALALSANSLTSHDTRTRRAQQASDAGVQAQLYEQSEVNLGSASYNFNGGVLGLSNFLDCTVPQLSASVQVNGLLSVAANSAGVCPEAESGGSPVSSYWSSVGDHAYYQSEMLTGQQQFGSGLTFGTQSGSSERVLFPEIVSLGKDDNGQSSVAKDVFSREEVILAPIGPLQAIEGMKNVSIAGITLLGLPAAATVNGDVLALGNLSAPAGVVAINTLTSSALLPTFAAASFSGTLISTAHTVSATPCVAGSSSSTCIIQRSPVTIAASKADCPGTCSTLLGSDYNPATDTFSMTSGSITFAAGDYVFCNFNATGGTINSSSTGPVRIFIDSPISTRCKGNGYSETGGVWNGGDFAATAGVSNLFTDPSGFQVYVVGDQASPPYDNATTVNIGNQSSSALSVSPVTQSMIVYAPSSMVTVNTGVCLTLPIVGKTCAGGVFDGSVVGDSVSVTAGIVTQDLDIGNYPLYAGLDAFRPVQYISCGQNNTSGSAVTTLTGTLADTSGC